MKKPARTLGRRLGQLRKSSNRRFSRLKVAKPIRASDIILGMTLAMLVIVLVVWLLAQLFPRDDQAEIDIKNINAGASHEPV